MGTRIFVGNLAYGSSEGALRAHFEEAGFEVRSARIIADRETGRSRGFGFVELAADDAARAIEALDGSSLEGRRLSIREAHDRKDGGGPPRDGAKPPRREAASGRVIVERVGVGEGRRGPPRGPRPGAPDGERPGGFPVAPEPGWSKGEVRRSRKFDGKRGGRRHEDDDSEW